MDKQPISILLADDDADDCIFFYEALVELKLNTHLVTVHDGEQLMRLLANQVGSNVVAENLLPLHSQQQPDVIFLDINMPRKNGFECLEEIKSNATLKHLPVIMFSTSFEQEVVNLLYKNGAQYFMRKPAEFSQLKKIIEQVLTLIAQNLSTDHTENIAQPSRENFVLTVQSGLGI